MRRAERPGRSPRARGVPRPNVTDERSPGHRAPPAWSAAGASTDRSPRPERSGPNPGGRCFARQSAARHRSEQNVCVNPRRRADGANRLPHPGAGQNVSRRGVPRRSGAIGAPGAWGAKDPTLRTRRDRERGSTVPGTRTVAPDPSASCWMSRSARSTSQSPPRRWASI